MRAALGTMLLALAGTAALAAPPIAPLDLARPFHTRAPWRLTATQGPGVEDPGGNPAPGAIALCLSKDDGRTCAPDLGKLPDSEGEPFAEPHYVDRIAVVHPRADQPLLLLQLSSLHGGNGDQAVVTRLLAYDRARDAFTIAYQHQTGRNNNQEVRYVADGPLKGAVIAVAPTQDAPFAFWVTVSRIASGTRYRQILRYRSATHYGDGNPLAVIDSEMPNIQQRLGLWLPGRPLPLPEKPCAKPHLKQMALWCG